MYKNSANQIVYSASDLILYMRSSFATWMERLAIEDPEKIAHIEKDQDAMMGLLAEKGNQHEEVFLEQLKSDFGRENVIVITTDRRTAQGETLQAMQDGGQVIFQAFLRRQNFSGYADFLVKREGTSSLGDYYYEAWDTKLSKTTRPYFIIQLCCYSWMLEEIQGKIPDEAVVVLGDGTKDRYRIAGYYNYYESLKEQFLLNQQAFKSDLSNMPDPALYSDYGQWGAYAKQLLETSDSLALVANIRKSQIKRLIDIGINSLAELARTDLTHVKGIAPETLDKLRAQADIQHQSKGQEKPVFKVLKEDDGKGLTALPPSSALDVFFDIEGHPLIDGGLEYLWGVSYIDKAASQGKNHAFKDWWAHTSVQEKRSFEGFIDWVYQRWQEDPDMHIYHYASYEITAIRKLSTRYQTRLDEVAELLKHSVFIDLYKIVKNGLLIGEPRYSIKNVEHLYRGKRTTDVASGGESVVFYDNWREQGGEENWSQQSNGYESWLADPEQFNWTAWPELKDIRDYNIDDCESTLELVDWLRVLQLQTGMSFLLPVEEEDVEVEKTERQINNEKKHQALAERQQTLIDHFEVSDELKQDHCAEILISLLHFYIRERKPQIWSYYDRLEKSDEELFDDDTVVHNITITSTQKEDSGLHCTAIYNRDQPVRTDKISDATVHSSEVKARKIKFSELNEHQGEISFVIKPDDADVLEQTPLTLFGDGPHINTEKLENRLCEITEQYFDTGHLLGAVNTILNQANPRFNASLEPLPVTRHLYPDDNDYLHAITDTVHAMNETCLCIQGPPGSGKTYTAKHVICALVKQGRRIGIMSNSHAAIMNLLLPLTRKLSDIDMAKVGGYGAQKDFKVIYPPEDYPNFFYRQSMSFTNNQPYEHFQVVGATAYAFVNDIAYEDPMDYLFVDEASQVALANLIAVSGAARNIILMGDQMQLEQPIQGSHPGDSGASALEFMLKAHAVIPEDKGVFLERTFRMHPAVCQPLSEVVYECKLQADEANKFQAINIENRQHITRQNGILTITVQHEGNTQSSEEEVNIVQQLINELKTGTFTNKDGQEKPITDEDMLIVAPYNMQVNLLKEKLKGDLKIGTIDKFQGQEAPVVIISMAVSDVEDSARGLDFVFDIHRLNVAISRAQAIAIIIANKGLEQCHVNSLRQMEKVGFYCCIKSIYKGICC